MRLKNNHAALAKLKGKVLAQGSQTLGIKRTYIDPPKIGTYRKVKSRELVKHGDLLWSWETREWISVPPLAVECRFLACSYSAVVRKVLP